MKRVFLPPALLIFLFWFSIACEQVDKLTPFFVDARILGI